MTWTCDVSIEEKVRQDCYNRGYEQGRKNPCEEIVELINRQKAEIERLTEENEQLTEVSIHFVEVCDINAELQKQVDELKREIIAWFRLRKSQNVEAWEDENGKPVIIHHPLPFDLQLLEEKVKKCGVEVE